MRAIRRLLLASALLLFLPATAFAAGGARVIGAKPLTKRVIELTVSTPAFAAPTKLHVNLPVGYGANPQRRWPVTYFTAGTMNRYTTFNSLIDGEKLSRAYPSIVVSPDANSGYWSDWYNGGAFGRPKYETFVIDQLIPLIDARYRTRADRSHRAIFGISMGGYGSLMLAARHPDLFAAAASMSGAVDSNLPLNGAVLSASSTFDGAAVDAINGPRATQEIRWRGHNPLDLAANLRGLDLQVRTANGLPNPALGESIIGAGAVGCVTEKGVEMASINLHQRLGELGMAHIWRDYGTGCHTWPNFRREAVDTLAVFKRALAAPPKPPATFDYRSIEPRFDVWGWHVGADPGRALEFLRLHGGRSGLTIEGSGRTTVMTAPYFTGLRRVDVSGAGSELRAKPDRRGRISFSVDLGPPHPNQQYTAGSRGAGQDGPGYFRTRTVRFDPRARLVVGPTRGLRRARRAHPFRVRIRGLGGRLRRVRVVVQTTHGRRLGRSRRFTLGERRRRVRVGVRRRLRPGRYRLVATGREYRGRQVRAVRRVRVP